MICPLSSQLSTNNTLVRRTDMRLFLICSKTCQKTKLVKKISSSQVLSSMICKKKRSSRRLTLVPPRLLEKCSIPLETMPLKKMTVTVCLSFTTGRQERLNSLCGMPKPWNQLHTLQLRQTSEYQMASTLSSSHNLSLHELQTQTQTYYL